MTVPLSKDEITSFTPASLSNMEAAPVFRFRPCTGRDGRQFQHMLNSEGLRLHQQDDIRAATLAAVEALSDPQEADEIKTRIETLWNMVDQQIEAPPDDVKAANDLVETLVRHDRQLRVMNADNQRFFTDAPRLAMSLFLVGWRGLETPFRRSGGEVPLDQIDLMVAELTAIEAGAIKLNVADAAAGTAYAELVTHALDLLNFSKAEAGKSPSLPPSPSPQAGSKMAGPGAANGKLPAKSSPATRPARSRR